MCYLRGFILLLACCSAEAAVLDFEDAADLSGPTFIYGGFKWNSISIAAGSDYPGSGYDIGSVSGDIVAVLYNNNSDISLVSDYGGTFDFIGASFTSAWQDQEVTLHGIANGNAIYSLTSQQIYTDTPTWIELNWTGIERLVVTRPINTQIALDDFTYANVNINEVPIPAAVWLFGSALGGLGWMRRRKTA
jgi:hypothetical protein